MPSIAGFIQSLLSEDMYATGMLEKMDERISQLNSGQLRLLVSFVENKVPGLTNKTVVDAYTKLLRKATAETEKRHEEEMRGERERLIKLKAAHAGVNAKAWDTSHASLDRELAKFQKFLKSKARRVAEEDVLQEEMEKLHRQLLALPERRVAADTNKHAWWAFGAVLIVVVGPILILSLLPVGTLVAVGAFLGACALGAACWFVGVLRGIVVVPTLDDDAIEEKTRKRARETLKGYRAEVRRTFEATEEVFAADMKWRDEWVENRKRERRSERRKAKKALQQEREEEPAGGQEESTKNSGGRVSPEEEEEEDKEDNSRSSLWKQAARMNNSGGGGSGRPPARGEGDACRGRGVPAEEQQGQPFTPDLSGAVRPRHNDPEDDDEGVPRDAEEGLPARPLGKPANTEDGPETPGRGGSPGTRKSANTTEDGPEPPRSGGESPTGTAKPTNTEDDPEAPRPRGGSPGTPSPAARRRSTRSGSTRSNGWRRGWRRRTFSNSSRVVVSPPAGAERKAGAGRASGEDRTRGPCQGSGPLDVSKQALEDHQQRHLELLSGAADASASASNVGATEEVASPLVPALVPGQDTEVVIEQRKDIPNVRASGMETLAEQAKWFEIP